MNRAARFVLCSTLLLSAAAAQRQPTRGKVSGVTANKLTALKVTGTARYTDKEILAASGLQIGQNAADGDFREAAQRLGDSGLFNDVVYSYSSSGAGVRLEMQLADTDQSKLVPAHFENFVWFTDAELRTALQRRVPLFKQMLPIAGILPDGFSYFQQAMLTEKQFPGRLPAIGSICLNSGT